MKRLKSNRGGFDAYNGGLEVDEMGKDEKWSNVQSNVGVRRLIVQSDWIMIMHMIGLTSNWILMIGKSD